MPTSSTVDVSVIIPTYRREELLPGAIESALSQKGVTTEVIVVDDSAEGTAAAAVHSMNERRVRYLQRQPPSGGFPGAVRNDGAGLARSNLLHFLDDDDRLVAGALQELKTFLLASGKGMAFGRVFPFGDDIAMRNAQREYFGRVASVAKGVRGRRWFPGNLLFRDMLLINSACMIRRDAFELHQGYDESLRCCEDVDLFVRIARSHGFTFVDRDVLHYRVGAPSIMNDARRAGSTAPMQLHSYQHMHSRYKRDHGELEYRTLQLLTRAGVIAARTLRRAG